MALIRQAANLAVGVGLSASAASARAGRVSKMRSALLGVIFTIIIQGERIRCDDFRPTPIPLDDWHPKSGGEVLHEGKQTDFTPSAALVRVHYWEDALRHSVYLTLVRDKIDQLIAKDGISSNSKTSSESKEIDDHDLWNKIKSAPFIRLPEEEVDDVGDVTVMAKGRLLENKQGLSFVEDERSKENCSDDKCLQGVKAFWSVKRVRQRDHETSQGKYHYELTFSVISQTLKKQKKSHENPIRTFTVRESYPKGIIDKPQEYRKLDAPKFQARRPERALWFHKNIAPAKQIGRRQFLQGFDKIFTTLFSGDDARDYDVPPSKYKQGPNGFPPSYQYAKINHLGVPSDHHQIPYPYRLSQNKQIRPPLSVSPMNPIQQAYLDIGQIPTANSNLHSLFPYVRDPNNVIKTTRPAVLPTPLPPMSQRDHSTEVTHPISSENLDNITTLPDIMKYQMPMYNKYKPIPVKVNYFPENVRPPVYNAPPGVFVTMDKKPFKPLPPMKYLHFSKPNRPNRPLDFRPSPQVMDVLFADPDSFSDTAFKPITVGYNDTDTTNNTESTDSRKKSENKTRKTTPNGKKPMKKHENIKMVSTVVPEIITAQSLAAEDIETLEWANILGAFTRTTPMISQTELVLISETTTPVSTTVATAIPKKRITTTTEAVRETTTTTIAPKKRTRPPQKPVKQEKLKKHKRITTTTSSTTTTTNAPENIKRKPTLDLTPQASSAATGTTKPFRESHNKTSSKSTTTVSTTTTTTTTTTTPAPNTTTTKKYITSTTKPKNKNRFRQSTLMLKGTSVKHDRWNSGQKVQLNATITNTSSSYRRKGSNFQGYMFSTTPRIADEGRAIHHEDRKPTSASTEASIAKITETTSPTQSLYEETVDQYETNSILPLRNSHEHGDTIYDEDTNESKDISEYTFQTTSSEENQKIEKSPLIELSSTPLASQSKNKTKCKKKKQNIVTTEEPNDIDSDSETLTEPITLIPSTARTSADFSTGNDILDELLNFNFNSDEEKHNKTSKGTTQEEDSSKNDEFEDFLGALEGITKKPVDESQYDDDDDETEENYGGDNMLSIDSTGFGDGEGDDDDEEESSRDSNDDEPPHDRPFSFLELMAMS